MPHTTDVFCWTRPEQKGNNNKIMELIEIKQLINPSPVALLRPNKYVLVTGLKILAMVVSSPKPRSQGQLLWSVFFRCPSIALPASINFFIKRHLLNHWSEFESRVNIW